MIDICRRIPEKDHTKIQFILVNGMQLNVDIFARFEPTYVVFRGREGGQTDEGRGFFIAYEDIVTVKLERVVKASELKGFYGEVVAQEIDLANAHIDDKKPTKTLPVAAITPAPTGPMDPAQIAKANLLARIRAARTAAGVGAN